MAPEEQTAKLLVKLWTKKESRAPGPDEDLNWLLSKLVTTLKTAVN